MRPSDGKEVEAVAFVQCAGQRSFGTSGEFCENPKYLDKVVETLGAHSLPDYEKKVHCCGGAFAFSKPEKPQEMTKRIIDSAYDHGADMIVTPCSVCQMNVEVYQDQINATFGTKLKMPAVYGRSAKDAALAGQVLSAKKLQSSLKG